MILCINVVNFLLKGYVNANNSKFIYLYPFINPSNFSLGATWVLFYQHILCVTLMENKVLFDFYIFNIVLNKTTHKRQLRVPWLLSVQENNYEPFDKIQASMLVNYLVLNSSQLCVFHSFFSEFLFSTKKVKTASFQRNSCIKY